MQSTPSLSFLPGLLCLGIVAPDKVLCKGLNITKLHTYDKLNCLN